jgi:hypothetical protein
MSDLASLHEFEEAEGADLGRIEAGREQRCDTCGGASYTGPRCTRCTYASASAPPWPVGREPSGRENGAEPVSLVPPEFVCPKWQCPHEVPGPVSDLWDYAYGLGWHVERRHSRGRVVGGMGKQLAAAELWSVRFRRGEWAGYAVRRDDAWDSTCISGAALPPVLGIGVQKLRDWLAIPSAPDGKPVTEWVAEIRSEKAKADLAKKIRACPGPGECEWVDAGRGDHTHRANGEIKIKNSRKEAVAGN